MNSSAETIHPAPAGPSTGPSAGLWPPAPALTPELVYVAEGAADQPAPPRLPLAFAPWRPALAAPAGPVLSCYLEDPTTRSSTALLQLPLAAGAGAAAAGMAQAAAGLPAADWHSLFAAAEAACRARGRRRLRLQGQPFCYDPAQAAQLAEVLRERGYAVVQAQSIGYFDLMQSAAAHLHPHAHWQLLRAARAGLRFEQEPPLLLPWAQEFMRATYAAAPVGPPPVSIEMLQGRFAQFPNDYFLFAVRAPAGEWAALAVVSQPGAGVLRVEYAGTTARFAALGPGLLLHQGLLAFGRASGLRILDLGTDKPGEAGQLGRALRPAGVQRSLQLSWELEVGSISTA